MQVLAAQRDEMLTIWDTIHHLECLDMTDSMKYGFMSDVLKHNSRIRALIRTD